MIIVYNTGGDRPGEISHTINTPSIDPEDGLAWVFWPDNTLPGDIHNCLISGDAPETRPTIAASLDKAEIVADGLDVATLSPLPKPCRVVINGDAENAVVVEDGALQIASAEPDVYRILVDTWPYLPAEFVVEAI